MGNLEVIMQTPFLTVKEQVLKIPGPVGSLEAIVANADNREDLPKRVAVICHPHSLMGGTMHNKVVFMINKTLRSLGLATVRFNFRGVGGSAGNFDKGIGETDDLLAVLTWVKQQLPQAEFWLAGFSFGAYVATRGALEWPTKQLITVAPPVGNFPLNELARPDCPWLVIQGDDDEVIDPNKVFNWAATIQPPVQLIRMEGAGHFFHGRLIDLSQQIQNALTGAL